MNKVLKVVSIIVAVFLIAVIMFVLNLFMGNPVSKMLVDHNSSKYIEENYGDLDLEKELIYNFKFGNYQVSLSSDTINDLHFVLYYDIYGNLTKDLYETLITNGGNVLYRINEDYRAVTDDVFKKIENKDMFNNSENFYGLAWISSTEDIENMKDKFKDLDGGIDGATLELDKKYDASELGKAGGTIDINVKFADGDESYEKGAEAIREIKKCFDESNVGFYYMNFGVFNEEGNYAYRVDYLPYSKIDDENLADILEIMSDTNPIYYDK